MQMPLKQTESMKRSIRRMVLTTPSKSKPSIRTDQLRIHSRGPKRSLEADSRLRRRLSRLYPDACRDEVERGPALLINAGSGTQMVNYRVKGNYYVVDRLFSDAILIAGVGRNQDRVTISSSSGVR